MDEYSLVFFIAFGFLAQLVDGSLSMGYGVCCSSLLLSIGIPPALASASVHAAEVVTTGVSGVAHGLHGNIDRSLLKRLAIPGVIGAVAGAYLLTELPGDKIKPFVAIYLAGVGTFILWKAIRRPASSTNRCRVTPCGFVGGFFDAIGGGGWGAIVTGNLVAQGASPRFTIGSSCAAEFFVTLSQSIVFFLTIGVTHWYVVLGLLLGGAAAAPLSARFCKVLPARTLMFMVGTTVIVLGARTIILEWFR